MKLFSDAIKPKILLWAGTIVIIVACFAAYIPAIKSGFIWDDDVYVTNNPMLKGPHRLFRIWFAPFDAPAQYVPLVYATISTVFWFEHQFWGFNPMGYHAVNVAFHAANALLLWLVLRRLSIPGAWFASAVFALHPVQVETVAWITELKNTLMFFFLLLSLLYWMKYAVFRTAGRKAYLYCLLLYALALFSKTTACTFPAALILILWFKDKLLTAGHWLWALLQAMPFVAMGIIMGLLAMWREKRLGTSDLDLGLNFADKILIAGRALWFYIFKLFWPANLTFSYPRWHIDSAQISQYAWPVAFLLLLAAAFLLRKRLGNAPLAAILFFALILFPMLGFFSLYTFIYTFVADHYLYVACIGPIALVAAAGSRLLKRLDRPGRFALLSAAGTLLIILGALTFRQSRVYADDMTLWTDTLKKNPDSWLAHTWIIARLLEQNKLEEAKYHAEQKIKLASYTKTISPRTCAAGYSKLAQIYEAQGNLPEAVRYYQQSLEIFDNSSFAHYRLAAVLDKQGNCEMAILHLRKVVEIAKTENIQGLAESCLQVINLIEAKKRNPPAPKPSPQFSPIPANP
jgi:tetratricopeptide (TPR) repeat protein